VTKSKSSISPEDQIREWVRILQEPDRIREAGFRPRDPSELMRTPSGRSPFPEWLPQDDNLTTITCACGRLKSRSDMPHRHSGVTRYCDNICPPCQTDQTGTSILVCARCRKAVARLPHQRDSRTGFKFQAGRHYHLDGCPTCQPPQAGKIACASRIIEKVLHDQQVHPK